MKKSLQKIGVLTLGLALVLPLLAPMSASAEITKNMCSSLVRDLTLGSTGSDVVILQSFLEEKGYLTIPAGVSKGYFGDLTRSAVARYQVANAISPTVGYFGTLTRGNLVAACVQMAENPGGGDDDGDLEGGDGDIQNINQTTSGTETTLGEAKTEDVLGFDIEADDNSDLEVTSIRVKITVGSDGSNRINRYLDEVAVTFDGEEVGSMSASKFSRNAAVHTGTISLEDTIIKAGEEERFYVTLTAKDSINDSDLDNTLIVEVNRVRVEDASGAVITEDVDDISETVDFEDSAENDDARVRSSSDTRDAGLLKIEENNTSDEFDILTFEIKVDDDSSDLVALEIPVKLEIENASSSQVLDVNKFIQDMWIEVDGEEYDDYDFNDSSVAAGASETITATFSIDEGDLEIAEGDTVDVIVFVKFGKQSGNYAEGSTIKAIVSGSDIVAENPEGDVFEVDGTANGEVQTVQISAAEIENFKWVVNNTGTIIDFFFTVTAEDEDFEVLSSSIASTTSGTATVSEGVLTKSTGDADAISGGFKVLDGDTATFRVRYSLSGSNGTYREVTVTSVAGQEVPDGDQVSPTATININN